MIIHSQTYFLNGSAQSIGDDCYQLTPELTTQNGTVWYGEQIDLSEPFDLSFIMNYGNLDGNGADGICFVLQTVGTSAIGESGGGLGYLNFGPSLGIEFDTWQNGEYGDPFEDHIAIEMNGDINHNSANNVAGPVQADPFDVNIEDGEDHVVRVVWSPEFNSVQVYFDCVFRVEGIVNLVEDIFNGQNEVYWGFTAATGGSYNNQVVCLQENIVTSASEVIICNGASAELSAGSSSDGIYTWSPADYLSSTTNAVVTATPPVNTTYTVTFTDLCGDLNELQIAVLVEDLDVTVDGLTIINCLADDVSLTADINFNTDVQYEWTIENNTVLSGMNEDQLNTTLFGNGYITANVQEVCFDTVYFEIESNFETYTSDAGDDVVLNCYNESTIITGESDGADAVFVWLNNANVLSNQASLEWDDATTLILAVANPASGCVTTDTLSVTEDFSSPLIVFDAQDTLSCLLPQVVIDGYNTNSSHPYTAQWSAADGNIVEGAETYFPTVNVEGWYTVVLQDIETGCTSESAVYVEENTELNIDPSLILFPNVFT
ncbi:MAG: L-type lectin-domain containing protein, partial [Flavobacteriales bacterium]